MITTHVRSPRTAPSPLPLFYETRTRVLVAEDDPEVRCLLSLALRSDGVSVVTVGDGVELLDHLGTTLLAPVEIREPVDLILADVRMPRVGGLDFLRAFRQMDGATPVVLLTAFDHHELRSEALRLGAAAVFGKPFDIHALRNLVRQLTGHDAVDPSG